jgi:hypothetical protein
MVTPTIQISQKTKSLNIFQRNAALDKTAVKDCFDTYGGFIWTLAKKLPVRPNKRKR